MTDFEWHPLAWEIARRAATGAGPNGEGVWAAITLSDGTPLRGVGPTSTAAAHDLARQLTRWADR